MVNILKLDWMNNYGFYCKLSVNYKKKLKMVKVCLWKVDLFFVLNFF